MCSEWRWEYISTLTMWLETNLPLLVDGHYLFFSHNQPNLHKLHQDSTKSNQICNLKLLNVIHWSDQKQYLEGEKLNNENTVAETQILC